MADNSLFIKIKILLVWAMNFERKKVALGRLAPLDMNGWVDVGLVMLAGFIKYFYVDANVSLHRNVSFEGHERLSWGAWVKRLELSITFTK
jgi:hypothetical protein